MKRITDRIRIEKAQKYTPLTIFGSILKGLILNNLKSGKCTTEDRKAIDAFLKDKP